MPITPLPTPPSRTNITNFAAAADALFTALPGFVSQANALEASLQAITTQGTSTTSLTIATGAKTLTTQTAKGWVAGSYVWVINSAAPANYMIGSVTSYATATGVLVLNVTTVGGTGTAATWNIALAPPPAAGTNLAGGAAGVMPYQSAAGVTGFTAAGTAGQVLQSNDTGAPTWTSTPTATTQPAASSSGQVATTKFVKSIGKYYTSILPIIGGLNTLIDSQLGSIRYTSNATISTINLPVASTCYANSCFEFICTDVGSVTINRQSTDSIVFGSRYLTSITLNQGDSMIFISDGYSSWIALGNYSFDTGWQYGLTATSVQFTHGLGVAPSRIDLVVECVTTDAGYAAGERALGIMCNTSTYPIQPVKTSNSSAIILATGGVANPWVATSRLGGALVNLTLANWRWKMIARL
jgi:hypothetical protein